MSHHVTQFLSVDLDIEAAVDLAILVAAMAPEAFAIYSDAIDGMFRVSVELSAKAKDADDAVGRLVAIVNRLPSAIRAIWDTSVTKKFHIGVSAGSQPHEFELKLATTTLRAVAEVGGDVVITVYGDDGP